MKMPGGGADGRALGEAGDLLGQLRLGERDLLADQQRGLLGDLRDALPRSDSCGSVIVSRPVS